MNCYLVRISVTDGENTVENEFEIEAENFTAAVETAERQLDISLR